MQWLYFIIGLLAGWFSMVFVVLIFFLKTLSKGMPQTPPTPPGMPKGFEEHLKKGL